MLYSKWREISLPTRIQIAEALGIKKHGPTHVRDNVVESDGYLLNEVEAALNVDKLQAYLGSDERDEATLVKMLVDKIEGNVDTTEKVEVLEKNGEVLSINGVPVSEEGIATALAEPVADLVDESEVVIPKRAVRRGRPKKNG